MNSSTDQLLHLFFNDSPYETFNWLQVKQTSWRINLSQTLVSDVEAIILAHSQAVLAIKTPVSPREKILQAGSLGSKLDLTVSIPDQVSEQFSWKLVK